ncbi:Hpt domain-containing protein [uncultured Halopseudomonas sp.]|uniref:Hpt domain-containing protein n=1 Tax=uncultured Halopseudomonas sp. TaxID=2901193 RepID=UPI0030EB4684|tara:strand:+ start:12497 stop:12847 length:351 start_codon:yes stop_codon:yes gene_type:complete
MADLPIDIDSSVQDALRELMQEDYALLVDTFSRDAHKRLAQLRLCLESEDWEAFRQAAHSFKGSCGNMGAVALQEACEVAERAGLEADPVAAQDGFEQVQYCFQRVAPLLGIPASR